MSRLGDMIKQERLRAGWSHKQLAKKSGVSESFLVEVEAGTKIITDTQATRILKVLGKSAEVFADFEGKADGMPEPVTPVRAAKPAPKKETAPAEPAQPADAWVGALGNLMHAVPVKDAAGKLLDSVTLPVKSGRIEGVVADKVFYLSVPDDQMMGYRIRKGDRALVLPATVPVDNAVMVFLAEGKYYLRKVKLQDGGRALMQWYDYEPRSEVVQLKSVTLVGRVRRVEFDL